MAGITRGIDAVMEKKKKNKNQDWMEHARGMGGRNQGLRRHGE